MNYFEYQKAVFDYLWQKHQQDPGFTFSVRQVATKDAERNYFIGKEKSKYFSFTCWYIPIKVNTGTDLTDFMFERKDNQPYFYFQYYITKSVNFTQDKINLLFGHTLLRNFKNAGIPVVDESTKSNLIFLVWPRAKEYNNINDLFHDWELLYQSIAPVMDATISEVKQQNPDWVAGSYSRKKFDDLIGKMHERIQRYTNAPPGELEKLPEETEFSSLTNQRKMQHPLNTILYGPPGTGKTYHTVNKAIAIANPDFDLENATRTGIKAEYSRLCSEGQIEFVTFHQSLSYEDFIEGIKPQKPKEGETFLKYEVQDGIFKILAHRSFYVPGVQAARFYLDEEEFAKASFYSLALNSYAAGGTAVYHYCLQNNCISLPVADGIDVTGKAETSIKEMFRQNQWDMQDANALNKFVHHLKEGNYVLLTDGPHTCRAIGKVTGPYQYKPDAEPGPDHYRPVEWLVKEVEMPVQELYNQPFANGIERLDKQEVKKEFFVKKTVAIQPELNRKNYVLIIDEINRGNVSQIFGELITLIEDDKRKGRPEALEVRLPYSKQIFSVPDNLYIIGTMNTADRSVEALDTALRRRFTFEEMIPRPGLLSPKELLINLYNKYELEDLGWDDEPFASQAKELYKFLGLDNSAEHRMRNQVYEHEAGMWQIDHFDVINDNEFTGINLQTMLETINQRLEALLSKDHTIGHAWLMNVYSLTDLQKVFKNKILPLLQEYFYNNYAKIGLVLGNRFVEEKEVNKSVFAKFKDVHETGGDYEGKTTYTLADPFQLELKDFKSIYAS